MHIVYIHGASATSESFSYIRQYIRDTFEFPDIMLDYNSNNGFQNNLERMKEVLLNAERLFFISHSLGGIYSLHLADYYKEITLGGISLSTPYGGSIQADFAQYFLPFSRLMKDIGTMSTPMKNAKDISAPKNWTQIITTKGQSPWIHEENDGVVTLKSMRSRTDFENIELPLNHYEVVLSKKTVEIIIERINKVL